MLLFYYGIYMRTRQQKWEPASKNEKSAISKRVLIFAGGFSFLLAVGGRQFLPFAGKQQFFFVSIATSS